MDKALRKVHSTWLPLIAYDREELNVILEQVVSDNPAPKIKNIFIWARYPLSEARVLIMGQDPYPTRGDADGMCFSSRAATCPASLRRIYSALIRSGLIERVPSHFSLEYLAAQGFILLNTALTTRTGTAGAHTAVWQLWMQQFLQRVARDAPRLIVCLWGAHARAYSDMFNQSGHTVLEWCHPVAIQSPSFVETDHFTIINRAFPIVWGPDSCAVDIFTDGAAKGNQYRDARCRAAWGLHCATGVLKGKTAGGAVLATEIKYLDGRVIALPSNIRAEGFAILEALRLLRTIKRFAKGRIYTDSLFWIKMIQEYMPTWKSKGVSFSDKKNSDLARAVYRAYKRCPVELIFVRAWHDYTPTDATRFVWEGNKNAEHVAESHLPKLN